MENVSEDFAIAFNIINAADDHQKHCDHNCNVSLGMLKKAAEFMIRYGDMSAKEENEINAKIKLVRWY